VPWKETSPMEERRRLVEEWARRRIPTTELAKLFQVSRKTAHKWIGRFKEGGGAELADRKRAPLRTPHATSDAVVMAIVDARSAHPTWGPRKLIAWLSDRQPRLVLPAPSTVGDILKSFDLVEARKKRVRGPARTAPFRSCETPNATWCADFKGEFTVGDRARCYPLTITDAFSRYLLCCEGLNGTAEAGAKPGFQRTFEGYGLPETIRTDGGPPFGSQAPCGLSRLSVWWTRLGIVHEIIEPGKPQQNGRHERMHLTLKNETALPPRSSMAEQQVAFDAFRREFNDERPHEALGQRKATTTIQGANGTWNITQVSDLGIAIEYTPKPFVCNGAIMIVQTVRMEVDKGNGYQPLPQTGLQAPSVDHLDDDEVGGCVVDHL
jgi:putative transposase